MRQRSDPIQKHKIRRDDAIHTFHEIVLILVKQRYLRLQDVLTIECVSSTSRAVIKYHDLYRLLLRTQDNFLHVQSRTRFWMRSIHSYSRETEPFSFTNVLYSLGWRPSLYLNILGIASPEETTTLQSTGIEGEIARDIVRTFPTKPFFESKEGQRKLRNVLKAILSFRPKVGYCQGMNYVAAIFLLFQHVDHPLCDNASELTPEKAQIQIEGQIISDQEYVFWILIALIDKYDYSEIWKDKMPGLSKCIYSYCKLIEKYHPDLKKHLCGINLHPSLLVVQWFVTLFSKALSLESLSRLWDLIFLEGWKMLYRIALAITAKLRPQLLKLDMEGCSKFLQTNATLLLEETSSQELIDLALSFKVTTSMLAELEQERHFRYLHIWQNQQKQRKALSAQDEFLFPTFSPTSFNDDTITSADMIVCELRRLDHITEQDSLIFRSKIEAAEKSIAAASSALYKITMDLMEVQFSLEEKEQSKALSIAQFESFLTYSVTDACSIRPTSAQPIDRFGNAFHKSFIGQSISSTLSVSRVEIASSSFISSLTKRIQATASSLWQFNATSHSTASASADSAHILEQNYGENEVEMKLEYLKILVPHLAADLIVLRRRIHQTTYEIHNLKEVYRVLMQKYQHAIVELEEQQYYKKCLSKQLFQCISEHDVRQYDKWSSMIASNER